MSSSYLENKIIECRLKINELRKQLTEKNKQIHILDEVERNHNKNSNKMTLLFENERNNLYNLQEFNAIKMLSEYSDDMNSLLSGTASQKFMENINSISRKINDKKDEIRNEINRINSNINHYEEVIRQCREQIKNMKEVI